MSPKCTWENRTPSTITWRNSWKIAGRRHGFSGFMVATFDNQNILTKILIDGNKWWVNKWLRDMNQFLFLDILACLGILMDTYLVSQKYLAIGRRSVFTWSTFFCQGTSHSAVIRFQHREKLLTIYWYYIYIIFTYIIKTTYVYVHKYSFKYNKYIYIYIYIESSI